MGEKDIRLSTDKYLIPEQVHQDCLSLFVDLGYEIEDFRGDTHAMGGLSWFPKDFILSIAPHIFDAVLAALAAKGLEKFVQLYKQVQPDKQKDHWPYPGFFITTTIPNLLTIYFELDCFDYRDEKDITDTKIIIEALRQMPATVIEIRNMFNDQSSKLFGSPKSLRLKYDFKLKRWIIREFNSDSSIFWDGAYLARHRNQIN